MSQQSDLFVENLESEANASGPVECLGMTFANDEERREHFLGVLRDKLKDPEFRKIEGFPIGSDENILALSDPPYYTACPNPFIADFIMHYGKPYNPATDNYRRQPFAADVSEGKNDPIYNAHSYHTKVPHKAIMRYILHYTEPGDVVFDGFCGTGMTGVAAQMCGDKATIESLGYKVEKDGTISQQETDENGKNIWKPFAKLGARRAILNDLSPAATFIAYNYNSPTDVNAFEREAKRILKEVEDECGWMYETTPTVVKQDLVISAYKPNGGFEERFLKEASTGEGVRDFVRTHLKYLPVIKRGADATQLIAVTERDPRILYDQMVAYFVRKGFPVPLNSAAFQEGLSQRFSYRDGMYFLPEQAVEYDKKRLSSGGLEQASLFVTDESSAIAWLRQLLKDKPQTFQDIHPLFLKELGGWQKHEKPLELSDMLEQNFLRYDGNGDVPNQIHSYLSTNFKELRNLPKDDESLRAKGKDRWYIPDPNKAGDLEKLRERSLLKEFEGYRTVGASGRSPKLKVFRLEAVRAGFKKAWQERDYVTIITVARKIPENVLQEDPKLLMWYDQAVTRKGGE
jgi:hypothetical protein